MTLCRITIANVATKWVLQQEAVASAIIGTRLGGSEKMHIEENSKIFSFRLDEKDMKKIGLVQAKGRPLLLSLGDVGDEFHVKNRKKKNKEAPKENDAA